MENQEAVGQPEEASVPDSTVSIENIIQDQEAEVQQDDLAAIVSKLIPDQQEGDMEVDAIPIVEDQQETKDNNEAQETTMEQLVTESEPVVMADPSIEAEPSLTEPDSSALQVQQNPGLEVDHNSMITNVSTMEADTSILESMAPINTDAATPQTEAPLEQLTTGTESQTVIDGQDKAAKPNKPKSGTFSLGVPGLTFSAQNLKVANDGTKMVQIHQSQITQDQLQALQANPNIKVVFRHIPTGKSFSKPPKNLFSCLSKQQGVKRKNSEDGTADESIYNFDEDFGMSYSDESRPKGNVSKYARYSPNVGMKKRGPGRPKLIPDALAISSGLLGRMKPPALPAQIMLTDAIAKLNKPNATFTVKIHTKQVSHDILSNMELHPDYNLLLTSKYETPQDHSLEELVKEWEEKEVEDNQNEEIKPEVADPVVSVDESESEDRASLEYMKRIFHEEIEEETDEEERLAAEQQRLQDERREREEAELLAAAMQERKSRSGRIRKPSRYSLDIARLTKRRNINDDASPDEDYDTSHAVTPPKPSPIIKPITPVSAVQLTPGKKRKRGRPRKPKPGDEDYASSVDSSDAKAKSLDTPVSSPPPSKGPMVLVSPGDKKLAENIRLQTDDDKKEDSTEKTEQVADQSKHEESSESKVAESTEKVLDGDAKTTEADKTDSEQAEKKPEDKEGEKMEIDASDAKATEDTSKPSTDEAVNEATKETKDDSVEKMETDETSGEKKEDAEPEADVANAEKSEGEDVDSKKPQDEEIKSPEQVEFKKPEEVRKISSDGETPSDILARKLDLATSNSQDGDATEKKEAEPKPTLTDFVEEEGDVDNKFRLRKLLQQCTIEEIRSVAIPKALESISIGDFFLHKADQMSTEKVKFASLYKQLEFLHSAIEKESVRYNTLLRRANKVGGERRMDKVILMPVYNKKAAESIDINSSSIDAHIGGIQQKSTAQMIAANSFRMNCKMEPPCHRLRLPDLADKGQMRNKRRGPTSTRYTRHPEPDSTTPDQPSFNHKSYTGSRLQGTQSNNWNKPYQVRKPSYLLGSNKGISHSTLQEHARMQLVGRYQSQMVKDTNQAAAPIADSSTPTTTTEHIMAVSQGADAAATTSVLDLNQEMMATHQAVDGGEAAAQVVADDGTTVLEAEEGKQLVAIGDGQYVELPEGYTLIQTDDGYIIGQPGATFVQGEDGNVYMTSTEDGTDSTSQVLTTTSATGEGETATTEALLEQLTQT